MVDCVDFEQRQLSGVIIMFPHYVDSLDLSAQHAMETLCAVELWKWREARQYFVAHRDNGKPRRGKWQALAKLYDVLRAAYVRATISQCVAT